MVNFTWTAIGFFLGFGFGVGCALAVMYSIYMGGYRAAVNDGSLTEPPPRLLKARASHSASSPNARASHSASSPNAKRKT